MTNDIDNISSTVSMSLPTFISGILMITGTAAVMLWFCWQLALLSFSERTADGALDQSSLQTGPPEFKKPAEGAWNPEWHRGRNGSRFRTVSAYGREASVIRSFEETSERLTKAGVRTEP